METKTDAEIADFQRTKQWRHRNPVFPLILALALGTVGLLFVEGVTVADATGFFVLSFLVSYIIQVIFGRFVFLPTPGYDAIVVPKDGSSICVSCHSVQVSTKTCEKCGGRTEHTDGWKWIPEDDGVEHIETVDR